MTENQIKFLELSKKYEELENQMERVRNDLDSSMEQLVLNSYLQDPESGLVYKIYQPHGGFVFYKKVDYKRTAKEGERGGSVLSKKEAEEAGFVVLKK